MLMNFRYLLANIVEHLNSYLLIITGCFGWKGHEFVVGGGGCGQQLLHTTFQFRVQLAIGQLFYITNLANKIIKWRIQRFAGHYNSLPR